MSLRRTVLGSVGELHRYPVRSLTGERLPALELEERGVVGDRLWAVRDPDGKLGPSAATIQPSTTPCPATSDGR